jgi:hypothetical protein
MHKSSGTMGTRKHGRSGSPGPSPRTKLMTALEANRLARQQEQLRPKARTFGSLKELLDQHRRR